MSLYQHGQDRNHCFNEEDLEHLISLSNKLGESYGPSGSIPYQNTVLLDQLLVEEIDAWAKRQINGVGYGLDLMTSLRTKMRGSCPAAARKLDEVIMSALVRTQKATEISAKVCW